MSRPRTPGASLLALALLALLVYILAAPGSSSPSLADCTVGAPEVRQVAPLHLGSLRASIARVLPQRIGRLYEEGTALASDAWSDQAPAPPAVSPTERRPDAYEMRWWAPNGDDVVADVFVFQSSSAAQRFLALAAGPRCHPQSHQPSSSRPPLARELSWINPDGFAEADIFLARGARVYRIVDAPPEQSPAARSAALTGAFGTIELLACLLPGARCSQSSGGVPT